MAKMHSKAKLRTHHNDTMTDKTVVTIETVEIVETETTNEEGATMIAEAKTRSNS